jgi:anthranilate phosphoribosyltransferase
MRMILAGEVEEIQLGAFLMLMRVKEETPEELAGFVLAVRETLPSITTAPQASPLSYANVSFYSGQGKIALGTDRQSFAPVIVVQLQQMNWL